jgi:hypothetical protein
MISGILQKATKYGEICFIEYVGGISLPLNECDEGFYSKLQQYIGEHIGIMRTNIPGKKYIIIRMRNPHHYNTKKKKNWLNSDQLYAYMKMYRKGTYRGAHKRLKVKPQPLSDFDIDCNNEVNKSVTELSDN